MKCFLALWSAAVAWTLLTEAHICTFRLDAGEAWLWSGGFASATVAVVLASMVWMEK